MILRTQQTIETSAEVKGIGLFTASDVTVRFLPAPENHGIAFQRIDVPDSKSIPATIDFTVHRQRRTAVERDGVSVEMTEHVLAALSGLHIDNCLIEINGPELPGCDGSSLEVAEALLDAKIVSQTEPRKCIVLNQAVQVQDKAGETGIDAKPVKTPSLVIEYHLNYGETSPIPEQKASFELTPETFLKEIAFARTFVLEAEVEALRSQGFGLRTTAKDLLVFGPESIIDNTLRVPNECARHKVLDCLGDLALLGCDLVGHFSAFRSGHQLNREMVRQIKLTHSAQFNSGDQQVA